MDDITWTINITQMLAAVSDALDKVEGELVGATFHHAKRIACLCSVLGRELGLGEESLFDLCACALLHDNALPEYLATEFNSESGITLAAHCVSGEANMKRLPVFGEVTNVLLYHHENADGTGPFHKRSDETPLYAKLIHLTDIVDVSLDLSSGGARSSQVLKLISEQRGRLFDDACCDLLSDCHDLEGLLDSLRDENLTDTISRVLPQMRRPLKAAQVEDFALLFASIVDYKSAFTARHSQGVAQKAVRMADFYGASQLERMQLLFSGALHDIGKLIISNDILEKPGRLTNDEFEEIQTHPHATWQILHQIEGLEKVTGWAAFHHEKLDGSGYPFGLNADALDRNARLMACIDIYQAMTEPRPYKDGLPHSIAMAELNSLADAGKLDRAIVNDIDRVFSS